MQIFRRLSLSLPLIAVPLIAVPLIAPAAVAAPNAEDCATFQGADADLTTLAGALRTISTLVADDASEDQKREAAESTGETLLKAGDIISNVATSVTDINSRQIASSYATSVKDLGNLIHSIKGTPDEETTHKAQELAKRVDTLSGAYDKSHNAACTA